MSTDPTPIRDLLRNLRDDCGHHDAPETRAEAEAALAALDALVEECDDARAEVERLRALALRPMAPGEVPTEPGWYCGGPYPVPVEVFTGRHGPTVRLANDAGEIVEAALRFNRHLVPTHRIPVEVVAEGPGGLSGLEAPR